MIYIRNANNSSAVQTKAVMMNTGMVFVIILYPLYRGFFYFVPCRLLLFFVII